MASKIINIVDLVVKIDNKIVLNKINLTLDITKTNVFLGPNGAGKSTLANVLMANPQYEIVEGRILLDNEDITKDTPDQRAKRKIFMSFQHPIEIEGVSMINFLKTSYNLIHKTDIPATDFLKLLNEKMKELELDSKFKSRSLNFGFSGGEKKKSEILQLLILEPIFAILDEVDSGLDVDSLKIVAKCINHLKEKNNMGLLIITHYNKILDYIAPDEVYVIKKGQIVQKGGVELIKQIEIEGFEGSK